MNGDRWRPFICWCIQCRPRRGERKWHHRWLSKMRRRDNKKRIQTDGEL